MSNSVEHLIEMANDIGAYFISDKNHERARDGVRNHLERFWDPRMRRVIVASLDTGDADSMSAIVREAISTHRQMLA
jgi:formate dehydrogenase subunit delta